jgi:conjugative relaxase-like TrwC/TraI family protein
MSSVRFHTAYSSSGVKNYFKAADYYAEGPETVGFWWGGLAPDLGLEPGSPVAKDDFDKLCDNINPATGKRLTLRTNEFRRVGEDMIFSLEKDLSVFILRARPELRERLLAMAQRRVIEVAGIIEDDVETRVRKDGAFENRPGVGLAGAGYLHTTARAVEGFAPDPQIHWHMFGFNATWDGVEGGRIKAADFSKIYASSGYYDALFNALVAYDFARLGLPVVNRGKGRWGIEGLEWAGPLFSKRTDFIEEEAKRLNITDAEEKDGLGAKTRQKKDKTLRPEQLEAAWNAQMTPEQRATLERLHRLAEGGGGGPVQPAVTAREAVEFAIAHCSEKLAVIPERELMKTALLHGLGRVTPEMIDRELHHGRHGLVFDTLKGEKVVTTEALKAEEREMADTAYRGLGTATPLRVAEGLDRTLPDGKKLNDEQWAAVTGLLESPNRINLVTGPAGAGKSKLLKKYDEGVRLAGGKVTYLAATGQAAEVLKEDGFAATTVASFLLNEKAQQAAKGGRVVVDETSILGHKDARRLLQLGKELNLKFLFVGDVMQHGSVSRGAFMRLLTEKGTLRPIKLTRILRQKGPAYRAAAQLFADGRAAEGFDALQRMGWVIEMADPAERARRIAGDYVGSLKECRRWQDVLVIAPTHAEAGAITAEIRSKLREAGKLGEERQFTRLVAVDTSEAERGQASTYRPGDVLVLHQNARGGFIKGDRVVVTDPARVPLLSEAAKFSVYREEKINVAVGDVVRFTGTVKTLGANPRVLKNGMAASVAGFTEAGNIRLDTGEVIGKDAGMFRHGFVETSIGSQGRTVRRVLLGMSGSMGRAANMQQLYVSATRSWESMRVYADDAATVRKAAERDSRQSLALDVQPGGLSDAEKRRLDDLARRSRQRMYEDFKASWEKAWGRVDPEPPTPPLPPLMPPPPSAGHAARVRERQQGMGFGHGR